MAAVGSGSGGNKSSSSSSSSITPKKKPVSPPAKKPVLTLAQQAAKDYTDSKLSGVNKLIVGGKVIVDKTGGKNIDLRPSSGGGSGGGSTRNIIVIDDKSGAQVEATTVSSSTPYGTKVSRSFSPVFSPEQLEADRTSIATPKTIKPITANDKIVGFQDYGAQQSVSLRSSDVVSRSDLSNIDKLRALSTKKDDTGIFSTARLEAETDIKADSIPF